MTRRLRKTTLLRVILYLYGKLTTQGRRSRQIFGKLTHISLLMYPTQRSRYIGSDLLTSVDWSELCIETCLCHLTASLLLMKLGRCLMDSDRLERELSLRCPQHPSHQVNLAQNQKQASRTSSLKGDALLVFKPRTPVTTLIGKMALI